MPIPSKEKQIARPSIRDYVYTELLNWIMDGVLRPGEKIVDKEIATHMGVSRTPVREALRRLEDKGLVESSANRWTRISEIATEEPEMIYPIIWTLEQLAVASAISNLTEDDFAEMERANEELKLALQNNDAVAASKADAQFHRIIIERTRNFHLISILEDLKIRYRRLEVNYFEGSSYNESSLKEHQDILDALKKNDTALAEKILLVNWQKSLQRLQTTTNRDWEMTIDCKKVLELAADYEPAVSKFLRDMVATPQRKPKRTTDSRKD